MLRITIHDSAAECRFRLEGRLEGDSVRELETCWRTASSTTRGRRTTLDLRGFEGADGPGGALLEAMSRQGVEAARFAAPEPGRVAPAWLRLSGRMSLLTLLLAFPPRF